MKPFAALLSLGLLIALAWIARQKRSRRERAARAIKAAREGAGRYRHALRRLSGQSGRGAGG
jgi:hypothetical protein